MDIRDRILEGAANLYKTYGIKAVTMDFLASQLGVSKRTIYEVFADKEAILAGVLSMMAKRKTELIQKILNESENAVVAIFRLLELSRIHFQDLSPVFQAEIKKFHHEALQKGDNCDFSDFDFSLKVIYRGIEEGYFRTDINPDIVNRCLFSLGRNILDNELYPFDKFTRREVLMNVHLNYLKGISTKQGIDLISNLAVNF